MSKEIKKGFLQATDGEQIAYILAGQGDTTLFFIHGWCINKEYWQNQIDHFSQNYKVVAIDLPGFGESSKGRQSYDFSKYKEDVKKTIDSLNLENVIIIGHSMSGDIILSLATTYPNSIIGLIGIDNLHEPNFSKDSVTEAQEAGFYDYMEANYDTAVNASSRQYLFQPGTPDGIVNKVMQNILATDRHISVNVLRSLSAISKTEREMMSKLIYPLKLVNSDVKPTKLDVLNQYCPKGAQVYYVKGTGHYPMIEKPEEFNQALQKAIHQN